jgi:putative tryptophan/tyrosine transport system substrate-binding protein
MQRRQFIAGLGSAAAWPPAARGQQAGRVRTIGFVGGNASTWTPWTAAFAERLRVLGWIEGRTVTIDYRWTEGRPERIVEIAAELVRRKVDVIVTNQQSAAALRDATSVIPIVFVFAIDPVGSELVASWGGRVATSLDCRFKQPKLQSSGSNSCVSSFPGSADWPS